MEVQYQQRVSIGSTPLCGNMNGFEFTIESHISRIVYHTFSARISIIA